MPNRASPYSTGCPLATSLLVTTPEISASISFMSFIDSMMQSTAPGCTVSPTRTKGGLPGEELSSKVPTIGDLIRSSFSAGAAGAMAATTAGVGAGGAAGGAEAAGWT